MTQQQNNNNKKGKTPQLFLLQVQIPPIKDGKEVFERLLKVVDEEMIWLSDKKPSEIIRTSMNELDAYQTHMFFAKISESRKYIELLKDVADSRVCNKANDKIKKLTSIGSETPPVELTGRVFATISFVNHNKQIKWLTEFEDYLSQTSNYKQLIALAMKIVSFTPAQAISYIRSLEYYHNQKKLYEVLK